MKKLVILSAAVFCVVVMNNTAAAQTTYTWNQTGTASWATSTNWTPTRTTPATNDIIVFNNGATTTVTAVPTQTIGQFAVSGSTTVNLQPAAGNLVLTISTTGANLSVAAGSALNISGGTTSTNTLKILVATGATGSISGSMTFSTAQHQLDAADSSGITFNSGSTFTYNPGAASGNPFNSAGTANAVVFASGSTYVYQTGANPFGLGQPSSKVVFQSGSLFRETGTGTPSFSGRTYANFELNNASANLTVTGGSAVSINDLTITAGTLNFNMTGTPGHAIKGNVSVASGATLNFNPASAGTLNLNGTSAQTISNSGTLTVAANQSIVIANTSGVTVNSAVTLPGTTTVNSGALLATASAITNSGTMNVNGTFRINQGGSALGNAFVYGASSTLSYNGTSSQTSTSIEFPASSGPPNLTINNAGGVTLHASRTITGVLALTNGDLNTTNSFTLFMGTGATSTGTGDVKGSVNRSDIGATTRSFGNPDVRITETAGTVSDITVKLVKGLTPNDFSNAVKRIYTITANNGTLTTATVRLRYIDSELNSNTEATLDLWRKDATLGWQDKSQTARNDDMSGEQNWVELAGVIQFSDWVISGPSAPTDVAMMNFKATRYDKQVLLEWQTGYEVSNIGFNIYREKNGSLERVTPEPVAGSALIAGPRVELKAGLAYSWTDEDIADCGSGNADCQNLRYWIEDIDLSGRTTTHGPFGVSEGAVGDQPGGGDRAILSKRKSPLLSALGREASLAQTAEAATVPVEPTAKVAKITAARMTIQSGVASQTAVKLSVRGAGWYRVEQSDLTAAGLPSNADPAMLQLLADGREVPMLITGGSGATGGGATGGGSIGGVIGGGVGGGTGVGGGKTTAPPAWTGIEFYGIGIDSPATVNHVYWLLVGSQPGLRITTSDAKGGPVAPGSFSYVVERRDKTVYFPALKNGGAEKWFGPVLFNAQAVDQSVNLQHVAPSSGGLLLVSLQGFNNTAHSVRVLFNGVQVGTMNFTGLQKAAQKFVIQSSNLHEGVNQIQLIGPPGTSDLSMVEFVQLAYAHTNTADNNSLRMPATGQQQVTIDGFTSSAIRVMDVTDSNSPVELKTTVNGAASKTTSAYSVTVVAPSSGARTLLAFASDQQKRPAAIVANQPSNYRDPGQRADYLIITRKDLIGSFGPLADLRKSQNLLPMLIDIDDIYDEFSFGNKTPQALKDFLTYAKTSWAQAPRFVVLAGDGTYDPKNYAGLGDFDLVPTRLIETAYNEAATDDWFGDVNGDGVPDIAIGRLPVRTPAEAAAMVTKLVSYDSSLPSPNVLLVADRNSNFDFESADTQLRALIPASLTVTDIRRGQLGDANARTQLLAALNQGAKVVNYYGHGSTTVWTDAPILSASDGARLTNSAHLSLVVSMTCLNGYFHAPSIESLGESLLKSQGGAIAVWASSGLTDAQAQTVMSRDAINRLLSGPNLTIGEVVALAKGSVTNLDVRRTWILLGDPATRLK